MTQSVETTAFTSKVLPLIGEIQIPNAGETASEYQQMLNRGVFYYVTPNEEIKAATASINGVAHFPFGHVEPRNINPKLGIGPGSYIDYNYQITPIVLTDPKGQVHECTMIGSQRKIVTAGSSKGTTSVTERSALIVRNNEPQRMVYVQLHLTGEDSPIDQNIVDNRANALAMTAAGKYAEVLEYVNS